MKSGRCVKCGETPILIIKSVTDLDDGFGQPMVVHRVQHFFSTDEYGQLQLYVCQACEYAEWYAAGAQEIPVAKMDNVELLWADDAPEKEAFEALGRIRKKTD